MKYQITVANRVRDDLLEQAAFVSRVSLSGARRYHREYLKILARLEENPFQFPVDLEIDLPGRTYRKAIFAKWFKVLFQVKDQRVYIDGIIDCRRDPAAIDF